MPMPQENPLSLKHPHALAPAATGGKHPHRDQGERYAPVQDTQTEGSLGQEATDKQHELVQPQTVDAEPLPLHGPQEDAEVHDRHLKCEAKVCRRL